jgi:hypothetical protein
MIHVVAMKCLIGLPLLMRTEILRRSRSWSRSFKNVGVGVGSFVYRLHSPGAKSVFFIQAQMKLHLCVYLETVRHCGSK